MHTAFERTVLAGLLALLTLGSTAAAAKSCKEEIEETRQTIQDHKDDYTLGARNKALAHLVQAEAKLVDLNPLPDMDCYAMVRKAKADLRQGKKKNAKKDKKD
ncbi:hypothetical protein DBR47_21950 [Paucibacter sp. KBW04]|uniref:hypothetical protein n=1 Tax=Paucibacter sp. KBW04 TaxID=2153361 RepID=UPI000F57F047|nr:hypothetical protein [Paucibacter sp. KBW04]RQO54735.1 hypothetical protein DBR47_21950 [Paucibacter sp. KBW04]